MSNRINSALVTACAALIAGCAGITVSKAPSLDSTTQMEGAPWNLAMTRFTVTITRNITQCGPKIKGKVETLASASTVADPEERYLLTSNGWFATSDIKSTLSSAGFSTALNAETADATAAIIGNVVGTAAQIAIAFAAAAAPGKPAAVGPTEICSAKLKKAVDTLYPTGKPALKKTLDEAIATLAQKTAEVAVLSAQASANKGDKGLKKKLVKALGDQEIARKDMVTHQDAFADAVKTSTNIQTVTWPDKSSEYRTTKPFSIDQGVLDKWLVAGVDGPNATKQLDVHLALYTQPAGGDWKKPAATTTRVELGLPVRLPRTAKLAMCTGKKCPPIFTTGQTLAENETVADFAVLQVGPVYALPISGGAFRSESAAITLDTNGAPTVLQTTQKVAAASALTGAAKDTATQLAGLPAGLRAAELAKTKADIDQANADIALQTAKQTAGLQGQTGTLSAQTALINAQVANSAAQQNASIQGFQQLAGSLNAQASVMQAQAVLATAQANSQVVDKTSALGAQTTLINAQRALLNATNAQIKAQTQSLP